MLTGAPGLGARLRGKIWTRLVVVAGLVTAGVRDGRDG